MGNKTSKAIINILAILMLVGIAPVTVTAESGDSLWTRQKLFGDMGGLRTALGEHGVSLDLHMSNIYQGVVDGGIDTGGAYGGIIDYVVNVDGHKLGLWKGLVANVHVTTQVGNYDSVVGKPGAFALSNTQLLYPLPGDTRTELTGWTVGQFLKPDVLAFGGKLNSIDLQTGFFPHLDFGRSGFTNTNLLAPALPWLISVLRHH